MRITESYVAFEMDDLKIVQCRMNYGESYQTQINIGQQEASAEEITGILLAQKANIWFKNESNPSV